DAGQGAGTQPDAARSRVAASHRLRPRHPHGELPPGGEAGHRLRGRNRESARASPHVGIDLTHRGTGAPHCAEPARRTYACATYGTSMPGL
ncbi:MAG: hypothetical protein AVDCRST_MAG60-701, partial [uncultured Nocardioides sp.]